MSCRGARGGRERARPDPAPLASLIVVVPVLGGVVREGAMSATTKSSTITAIRSRLGSEMRMNPSAGRRRLFTVPPKDERGTGKAPPIASL